MIQQALASNLLNWKEKQLKRNEFLIRKGQIERSIYFIKSGAVRAYLETEELEHTLRFGYQDSILTSIPSFFNGQPSELYIQAIRSSQVLIISKEEFESYVFSEKELLVEYNHLLKELTSSFLEREIDLLTQSPAERIHRLFQRSPQVFQEIPYKYIASYLRMTPETFSRLLKS